MGTSANADSVQQVTLRMHVLCGSTGADVSGVDAEEQQVAGLPQPYVLVPTKPTHSTSAHAGGCFGLTFTR